MKSSRPVHPIMPSRVPTLACALTALVTLAIAAGCGGRDEPAPCVATPTVTLNKGRAAIGSPLTLTYRFDVAQGAAIAKDYTVFVHVLDTEGERLWGDDHVPQVPTSQWKAGQQVEYQRTLFVPNYPYVGEANIRLGLYDQAGGGDRLPLCGTDLSRREYGVGRFELLPQSENVFLIYKEGWHSPEIAAGDPTNEWQWTKGSAIVSFKNPKKDATLYLEYDARPDLASAPQQVTIRVGAETVATFAANATKDKGLLSFPVTAAQFGSGDTSDVTIDVGPTFTPPGGTDTRQLGIRVFHLFVEPK